MNFFLSHNSSSNSNKKLFALAHLRTYALKAYHKVTVSLQKGRNDDLSMSQQRGLPVTRTFLPPHPPRPLSVHCPLCSCASSQLVRLSLKRILMNLSVLRTFGHIISQLLATRAFPPIMVFGFVLLSLANINSISPGHFDVNHSVILRTEFIVRQYVSIRGRRFFEDLVWETIFCGVVPGFFISAQQTCTL